jgi:hypothetical protein
MIVNADRARANLMQIIDKLFLVVESSSTSEPGRKKPIITIHPDLTYATLDVLINQAREMIIILYVGCERDFYTGLSLLHVIIEEIMNANMNARLDALKIDTRKSIEKLSQDAVRANARNGIVRSNYDTSDPALLSSSQLQNFVNSEKSAVKAKANEQLDRNTRYNATPDTSAPSDEGPAPDLPVPVDQADSLATTPDANDVAQNTYDPNKQPARPVLKKVGFAPPPA